MHYFLLSNRRLSHIAIINGHWIHLTLSQMEQLFQTPLQSRGLTRSEFKTRLRQTLYRMFHFPRSQKPQIWTERVHINRLIIQRSRILMNTKYMLSLSINVNTKLVLYVLYHASVFCAVNWNLLSPLNCMFYLYTMGKHTTGIALSFIIF